MDLLRTGQKPRGLREQRKAERFYGQIPVELKQGTGLTRDCSTSGIYFVTDQKFSVGEQVELALLLDHTGLGQPIRLRCSGEIVRLEADHKRTGVAVAIRYHQLQTNSVFAAA